MDPIFRKIRGSSVTTLAGVCTSPVLFPVDVSTRLWNAAKQEFQQMPVNATNSDAQYFPLAFYPLWT
jgi:hypothetical protein